MNKLPRQRPAIDASAAEWPSWTDEVRFVPTDADAAWAAEHLNEDDGETADDDPLWETLADEAMAQDRLERGLCL